jgi:hypothetical protein
MPYYASGTLLAQIALYAARLTVRTVRAWMRAGLRALHWYVYVFLCARVCIAHCAPTRSCRLHTQASAVHGDAHAGNMMLASQHDDSDDNDDIESDSNADDTFDLSDDDDGDANDDAIPTHLMLFDFDESWRRRDFLESSNFEAFARIDCAKVSCVDAVVVDMLCSFCTNWRSL